MPVEPHPGAGGAQLGIEGRGLCRRLLLARVRFASLPVKVSAMRNSISGIYAGLRDDPNGVQDLWGDADIGARDTGNFIA